MKTIDVVILIMTMLSLARASSNTPFGQVEPNNKSNELICSAECIIECAPFTATPIVYQACLVACNANCHKMFIDVVYNCITSCGLTKSIDINTGHSQNKKRKNIKDVAEESSQQKKPKKNKEFTCYFRYLVGEFWCYYSHNYDYARLHVKQTTKLGMFVAFLHMWWILACKSVKT
ncbi:hypothetical protein CR513_25533, partial [Mucuna pruriens]